MADKIKKRKEDEALQEGEAVEGETPDMEEAFPEEEETKAAEAAGGESLQARIAALEEEVDQAQAKADENLDGWQRALADFSNYRKRVERERDQFQQESRGSVLKSYLEIVDDLERALKNRPEDGEGAEWAEGIELIYRKLQTMLENEGVVPMEAVGQTFDPNLHEAIFQEESEDHDSGVIIEVIQQGYMLGERVLRPARVRIAS